MGEKKTNKITVQTTIREVTLKVNDKGSRPGLKFDGLNFSEEQLKKLEEMAGERALVNLTIEPVQEKLPME